VTRAVRPGAVLGALCASLVVITANISLLNVGLPTLARDLNTSNTALEWVVDSYTLVFAGFLLSAGALGDRFGRRSTLMVGLVIFGASSTVAAFTHSAPELIGARAVMGLGAACVMPMTLSILTTVYPTEAGMRRAIGVWAATASAGAVIAPLVAGLLLRSFWWGSLFLVNLPFSAVTLLAVILVVPPSVRHAEAPIDWLGAVLSVLFCGGLVATLIEGPERGWTDPLVLGGLVASVALAGAFWLTETRLERPLLDVRAFRIPRFTIGCTVVAMQYFFSFGTAFVITQYLQLVLGYSALTAGIALMPSAALLTVVAPFGAWSFGRFGGRRVIVSGLLVAAAGALAMNAAEVDSTFVPILIALMLISLGIGILAPGTTSMVMNALPQEQAGMASGAQSTTRQLGGALGIAVLGSLLSVRYSSSLAMRLAGVHLSNYLSGGSRSLAAALDLAHGAGANRAELVEIARSAFVDGVHLVGTVAAIASAACAGIVFIVLRRVPEAIPAEDESVVSAAPASEGVQ
jgi:EmrB/QacA subfamily drug resistance transporter